MLNFATHQKPFDVWQNLTVRKKLPKNGAGADERRNEWGF